MPKYNFTIIFWGWGWGWGGVGGWGGVVGWWLGLGCGVVGSTLSDTTA